MRSEKLEAVTNLLLYPFKRELLKNLNNQGLNVVENDMGKFTYEELRLILKAISTKETSQLLEWVRKEGQIEVRKLGGKKGSSRLCFFNPWQVRLDFYRPFFELPRNIPEEWAIRARAEAISAEVSKAKLITSSMPELVPSSSSSVKEPAEERRSSEKIRIRKVEPLEKKRTRPIEKRETAIAMVEDEGKKEEETKQPVQKKTSTVKEVLAGFNVSPKAEEKIISLTKNREAMEIIKRAAHKLSPGFLNLTARLPIAILTKGTPSHKIGYAKDVINEAINLGLFNLHGGGRERTYGITGLGFRIVKWYASQESQEDSEGKH
jgi:hypothetical protein